MFMKKSVVLVMAVVFALSLVSAAEGTTSLIRVKTAPGYDVAVNILNPNEAFGPALIDRYQNLSNAYGDVYVPFTTDKFPQFTVTVIVRDIFGEPATLKRFTDVYAVGSTVDLTVPVPEKTLIVTPDNETWVLGGEANDTLVLLGSETLTNETNAANATINQTDVSSNESVDGITGNAIEGDDSSSTALPSWMYFVLAVFIVGALFVMIAQARVRRLKGTVQIHDPNKGLGNVDPKNNFPSAPAKPSRGSQTESLKDAEEKILEAQQELEQVKLERRIAETQKKLQQDRDALDKIKKK